MIEINDIEKTFDDKQILFGISAKFYDGKTNLIIGQSGSGKTVLMKSLVGLVTPEKGEILFDGRDLMKMSISQRKELRKEIGMLFQGSALFDSETVLGNVMFPLVMFSDMSDEEKRLAIDNLEEQMLAAAARLDFEKAAKLRDQLMELKGEAAPAPATEPRKRQRRKRRQ